MTPRPEPAVRGFDPARGTSFGQPAVVVHPMLGAGGPRKAAGRNPEGRLAEIVGLAAAIRLDVREARILRVRRIHPATLFGSGQVAELAALVQAHAAELLVVDAAVTPVQQKTLEDRLRAKVIDRTGLILEIFGERAATAEGRLQVELAHLEYQAGRLVRSWTHLERQRGGFGFLGGPGETQIETDRRLLRDRIARIRRELEDVRRTRTLHRARRKKAPWPVVALVGYTNAGKSTLFNRLTGADVLAEDMLFATLDPTMRRMDVPGQGTVILSDTVGFVSELPTGLVAAFRATLEEVQEADLLLHVRDVAHPESEAQAADVAEVLQSLGVGAGTVPVIEVLNKADLLDPEAQAEARARYPEAVLVSAATGEGIGLLRARITDALSARGELAEFRLHPADGARLAWLYAHAEVLDRQDGVGDIALKVRISAPDRARFAAL